MHTKTKISLYHLIAFLTVILSACISQPTYSQDLTQSQLYYFEGNQRIELTIQNGMLAEFNVIPASDATQLRSPVKSLDKGATLLKSKGSLNLWKTSAASGYAGISKSLNDSGGKFSPVFLSSQGGGLLSLPGNVLVEFTLNLTQSQVENFLASKGLRIFKKLELIGRNYYEVETPAGPAALNIANSLVGQAGVISSSPNWWREAVAK